MGTILSVGGEEPHEALEVLLVLELNLDAVLSPALLHPDGGVEGHAQASGRTFEGLGRRGPDRLG